MQAMMKSETGLRTDQRSSGLSARTEKPDDLLVEKIVAGARVLIQMDRYFSGRSRREHPLNIGAIEAI
jgi:hypothetical protein